MDRSIGKVEGRCSRYSILRPSFLPPQVTDRGEETSSEARQRVRITVGDGSVERNRQAEADAMHGCSL